MENKVLLVTGSSRGIGAATAIQAASKGYSICVNYLNDKNAAHSVRDKILKLGIKKYTSINPIDLHEVINHLIFQPQQKVA